MHIKINALTSLFLLTFLTSCVSNYTCPARTPFTGATYGDLVYYNGELQVAYDACAEPKPKKMDWGALWNNTEKTVKPIDNHI